MGTKVSCTEKERLAVEWVQTKAWIEFLLLHVPHYAIGHTVLHLILQIANTNDILDWAILPVEIKSDFMSVKQSFSIATGTI